MTEINIKSSTMEKSIDLIKDFLKKVIGPSADELGLMFADNLKLRRFKNQIKNFEKVKEIVEKEGISVKQINLKVLVPYLDGVSLEEEDSLQNVWANMFVNYIDSNNNLVLNVYPYILKQLSTNEISILQYMESNNNKIGVGWITRSKGISFTKEEIANLNRLGLIEQMPYFSQYGGDYDSSGKYQWQIEQLAPEEYFISDFGSEFLSACTRK